MLSAIKKHKVPFIIGGSVLTLLIIGLVVLGSVAAKRTVSVPGISINGTYVGECTLEQIKEKISSFTPADYGYKTLSVSFSDDVSFEVTPEDAGTEKLNDELAEKLFNLGRDGGFIGNGLRFLSHSLSQKNVSPAELFTMDTDNVKRIVEDNSGKAMALLNELYHVDENDMMTLIKGSKIIDINPDNVYKLVEKAYKTMNFDPVRYEADDSQKKDISLDEIYETLRADMVEATYDKKTGEITDDTIGIDFDLDAAKTAFEAAADGEKVEVPLTVTRPKMSAEILRTRLFEDVLSEKSTPLTGNANRVNNIAVAAQTIDGLILMPSETFSFNGSVGERTKARGYKEAAAYAGGETVQQVGGGICQVSSTLYCCTLLANLEVVDRSEHMFPVSYLPYGMDATVNWGTIDYKFKNTTNYPLKISTQTKDGYLTIKFLGVDEKQDGHTYKLTYSTVGYNARKTEYKTDSKMAPGTSEVTQNGFDGAIVDLYRTEYDADGNKVTTDYIARSSYRSKPKIIVNGPEAPAENTSEE